MTPETKHVVHSRIASVTFVESVGFLGEMSSAQVGRNVDRIEAARIDADGTATTIDKNQRADGLVLSRNVSSQNGRPAYQGRCFVPWANVRGVTYGE